MMAKKPAEFYKYMSFKGALTVIRNGTFRFAARELLNDENDMKTVYPLGIDKDKFIKMATQHMWQVYEWYLDNIENFSPLIVEPEFEKKVSYDAFKNASQQIFEAIYIFFKISYEEETLDELSRYRICCFTDDPTDPTMWANYAEEEKGAILVFDKTPADFTKISEYERMGLGVNKSLMEMALKVTYADVLPPLFKDEQEFCDLHFKKRSRRKKVEVGQLLLTKHISRQTEKEWRIILSLPKEWDNEGNKHISFPCTRNSLKKVIVGANMSEKNRKRLKKELSYEHDAVEFYEAIKLPDQYRRELVQLEL